MNTTSKIYLAGHDGLVGSAILRNLKSKGYNNFVFTPYPEFDLTNQQTTADFFKKEKPEYVFLAAAKVGGIMANNTYRAQFIYENIQIQNNVIHQSYLNKVKKLLFLGSSCIYPKNAPQPMKEEYLLTSELEYTNEPYAIAKIAGIKMCESYNIQYGTNFIAVMPTNLYGPGDNYDLEKSHVLPALIRKMHLGKCLENNNWEAIRKDFDKNPVEGIDGKNSEDEILQKLNKYGIIAPSPPHSLTPSLSRPIAPSLPRSVAITLWGTGKPHREFLHVDDMADACVYVMNKVDFADLTTGMKDVKNTHINIGCGEDLEILELANIVKSVVGFTGKIIWDKSKPDGTYQKLMDVNLLKKHGWQNQIGLKEGLEKVYEQYS
ncbi:MAG: GDP-L-fucose synthase [Bacteroidetes bacterium]|nr:GDP-L-fucose synthase [Bacteroidota bacterium]